MAVLTAEVKGDKWPSILDGDRTDRGWEHYLQLNFAWTVALGDDVQVRLIVPPRESWVIEYATWDWEGAIAGPTWTSARMLRELRHGLAQQMLPLPIIPWTPITAKLLRTLYTIPGTDEEDGVVHRSQREEHLGGLRAEAVWGFDWINNTIVAAEADSLNLRLHVVRIPVARPRVWGREDLGNALTGIDELSRRVT